MKFSPMFTITNQILANIKQINTLVINLNNRRFPTTVLMTFEKEARAFSSHTSTKIEGNSIPLTDVKKLLKFKPEYIKDTEREVLNYNNALLYLNNALITRNIVNTNPQNIGSTTSFNEKLILRIHKFVTDKLLPKYQTGKFRTEPVVVNNPKTGRTVYLPPDVRDVKPLVKSLIDFVNSNRGEIDPLILAGIFHKQFVLIHPFIDGNGRTCRLVTKSLLAELGIDTFDLFSFENYYNNNVSRYFQKVGEFGDYYDIAEKCDFTQWLEYFTLGIIDEIERVSRLLEKNLATPEYALNRDQNKIINTIRDVGYITDSTYSKLTDRAKATRVNDFNKLIELKCISRNGSGRKTYYTLAD